MVETKNKTDARPHLPILNLFEEFERAAQGSTPSWLQALHKGGIAHFAEMGFPTTHHEEWRFTNIAPIVRTEWRLPARAADGRVDVQESDLAAILFANIPGKRLVFVNGRFARELSSRETSGANEVRIQSLYEAVRSTAPLVMQTLGRYARYDESPFAALSTAFVEDGAVLIAPPGHVEKEPIYILHLSTGSAPDVITHPRTLILAQRGAELTVIEHFASLGKARGFTNSVTEIVVEESASVEHCKIQNENLASYHIGGIQVQQARSSRFLSHSVALGGALTRNNINCVLDGEAVESTLNGLYIGRDTQLVDHHTAIFHNKPNCNSHEHYHGILDGRSQAVFNGKIFVRPEAQKTDAKQTNRNLLLSDEATIDTKPQLEIFADDVKCTHGATVGQLDQEAIFYLRARGIGLENARRMLLHAFASEIINRLSIEPLREQLDAHLFEMYERQPQSA